MKNNIVRSPETNMTLLDQQRD